MRPQEHRTIYALEENYWWFKAKRHLLTKTVKNVVKNLKGDVRLLDGGCGTGVSLVELNRIVPSVGIEKFQEGLKLCKKRNLKNLISAELQELPFKNESFDVVLAMDALDHVDNDVAVLKEMNRIAKEQGYLLIHVPAFMFLWSDHDVAVDHKRRYTIKELSIKLKEADFEIKHINYRLCLFFPLGFIKLIYIWLRKTIAKKKEPQACRPKVGRLINALLYTIVKCEDALLNFIRLPFGLSVFCIAQKKKS